MLPPADYVQTLAMGIACFIFGARAAIQRALLRLIFKFV